MLAALQRLRGSSVSDFPFRASRPPVERRDGVATLRLSVGALGASGIDREWCAMARGFGLVYESDIGRGLLLRDLVITVRGEELAVDAFVDWINAHLRTPETGGP